MLLQTDPLPITFIKYEVHATGHELFTIQGRTESSGPWYYTSPFADFHTLLV